MAGPWSLHDLRANNCCRFHLDGTVAALISRTAHGDDNSDNDVSIHSGGLSGLAGPNRAGSADVGTAEYVVVGLFVYSFGDGDCRLRFYFRVSSTTPNLFS